MPCPQVEVIVEHNGDCYESESQPESFGSNGSIIEPVKREGDHLTMLEATKRSYFSKLLASGGLCFSRALTVKKSQTMVIFDWDDTLLCTSFLNRYCQPGAMMPPNVFQYLRTLEDIGTQLLEQAMEFGYVYIVTNATPGWVEESAARWAPKLLPVLDRIQVISARDRWGASFPEDFYQWKTQTFLDLHRYIPTGDKVMNIVSIGDADFELQAALNLGKQYENAVVKTVKLKHYPSPAELVKQLELVKDKFDHIYHQGRNLKISLERKKP